MLSDTQQWFNLRYGRPPSEAEFRLLVYGPPEELYALITKLEANSHEQA